MTSWPSLQYLDTLKALGGSPATKFVLPAEFTSLLRPFLEHMERGDREEQPATRRAA